ncbi:hypothetical protein GUJ93_ZPchr0007g3945 [Zizania palustris]|uniref:Uncharacterized protein n=1 Tax=Zizania palustris TaxID=103762 RepID=A0A8J5TGF5_ZIZPA|nr:hypothetical protein GUJ93_ZPchr0007g3945 [Zizania palustris]
MTARREPPSNPSSFHFSLTRFSACGARQREVSGVEAGAARESPAQKLWGCCHEATPEATSEEGCGNIGPESHQREFSPQITRSASNHDNTSCHGAHYGRSVVSRHGVK